MARLTWDSLPTTVRTWTEQCLGGSVVRAVSQPHGFSSGTADRVQTAHGTRAFIKAISRGRNDGTFELHRQEAVVMRMLPDGVPAPGLLGVYDDDEWIALLLTDIEGVHPGNRGGADIPAVLDALARLPVADGELGTRPPVTELMADDFGGWARLTKDRADEALPPAALLLRDRMIDVATGAHEALRGGHLVHFDCRADNVLISDSRDVWLIDWPWACAGPRWLDALTYLLDVEMRGEPVDVEQYLRHPIFEEMTATDLESVLAVLAGSWYDRARHPAPADIPGLRAFQRAEADAAVSWLMRRWQQ